MNKLGRCLWALDNVEGMSKLDTRSITLAYLDPPFNSGRTYRAQLTNTRVSGKEMRHTFSDTWQWTDRTEGALRNLSEFLPKTAVEFVKSLATTLGRSSALAYLIEMAPILAESHRVLKHDGSLYVHCDPAASHYLKILLDHIFGRKNFRNEIIWKRTHAHSSSRRYGPVHDTILFYSKSSEYVWNSIFAKYQDSYFQKYFRHRDESGNYQLITCTAPGDRQGTRAHYEWRGQLPPPGRHWAWKREKMEELEKEGRLVYSCNGVPRLKRYTYEGLGVAIQDVWIDINRLDPHSRERIGFETQKPIALLERIIEASSSPGDIILDPFAGSGTTAVAAERMKRNWVAMDNSLLACAIALARVRQEVNFADVMVEGFPENEPQAQRLLRSQPAAFGIWGTSMLGSIPNRKRTNATVVVGNGKLSVRSRKVEILSWVPIGGRIRMSLPVTKNGKNSSVGFVLRHDCSAATVQRWLNQRVNIPTYLIDIEHLVDTFAHSTGLSSALPELLQTKA